MFMRVSKDKKLADALEALTASVSMVGGLPAGYEYLRSLGVAKTKITTLQDKWNELMFKPEPVI